MTIILRKRYKNEETEYRVPVDPTALTLIKLGRYPETTQINEIDLEPDKRASREHAYIYCSEDEFWIEDHSRYGTSVNERKLDAKVRTRLYPGDTVSLGEGTTLQISWASESLDQGVPKTPDTTQLVTPVLDDGVIVSAFSSQATPTELILSGDQVEIETVRRQLDVLYRLSDALGTLTDMNGLLQTVVDYIYTAIPNISNCGVLMLEAAPGDAGDGNDGNDHNGNGRFMLNYYQPLKEAPYFSETVARTALETGETFIWQRSVDRPTESLTINNIESAMCAVLKHQQEQYGVLFVNNTLTTDAFTENDVKLLGALAGQAGMFIRNQKLQETLRREEVIRANFMKHFSPKVAERLMNQETALRLGGELVNPVTVLFSDVRGFTLMSAGMEPGDVLKMLNTLFSELTPIIFRYNGTIDKYIGDAILAVFGSPERDDDQHFNAVQAALAMQAKVNELAETMQQAFNIASPPKIGIGIHTGELVHGFLGALERIEYTVIGDTVNMTSRYCAGADGGEVVISEAVYMRVKDHIHATQKLIQTKHEGDINGFLVQAMHAPGQVAIG